MISQVKDFLTEFVEKHGTPESVVDVGSLDVNGNPKSIFGDTKYIGVDMRDGPNVDLVLNGHDLRSHFPENSVDCVICVDTLEHDNMFWKTVEEMRAIVKPGGWMIITVPSLDHGLHNHPSDYYRFFDSVFKEVFFEGYEEVEVRSLAWGSGTQEKPDEILGWGKKPCA